MIKIEHTIEFETYDQAFNLLCEMDGEIEEGKLFESCLQFEGGKWSFVTYPPDRVAALYRFAPAIDPSFQKAYEEQLGLLEICAGDYRNPQYTAITPDVDVNGLKKQWLQNYCAAHGLAIEVSSPADFKQFQEQTGGNDGQNH